MTLPTIFFISSNSRYLDMNLSWSINIYDAKLTMALCNQVAKFSVYDT